MTFQGHVKDGVVVFDDPVSLPDGTKVRVEPTEPDSHDPALDENGETLGQKLLEYAGKATGLPPDAARNHDHYLYGTPKRVCEKPRRGGSW